MEHLVDYIKYFFLSMAPVFELRGALPLAITAEGLNPIIAYLTCVLGNCFPVPFLIFFVRPIFDWLKNTADFTKTKLAEYDTRLKNGEKLRLHSKFAKLFLKIFHRPAHFMKSVVKKLEEKAHDKAGKVKKYEMLGLFLFVAVPLPGTGAWTGSLIAAVLGMRVKDSVPMICLGVFTAGILMTLGSAAFRYVGEWVVSLF